MSCHLIIGAYSDLNRYLLHCRSGINARLCIADAPDRAHMYNPIGAWSRRPPRRRRRRRPVLQYLRCRANMALLLLLLHTLLFCFALQFCLLR